MRLETKHRARVVCLRRWSASLAPSACLPVLLPGYLREWLKGTAETRGIECQPINWQRLPRKRAEAVNNYARRAHSRAATRAEPTWAARVAVRGLGCMTQVADNQPLMYLVLHTSDCVTP